MPRPVKLSDGLVEAARKAADGANRSLADQIEHWARLGRSVESSQTVRDTQRTKRSANKLSVPASSVVRTRLLRSLQQAFSPAGRKQMAVQLLQIGGARYGIDPALSGLLVRIEVDGTRTPGRWVNRRFVPIDSDQTARPRA